MKELRERLLTVKEFAETLGMKEPGVRRWLLERKITSVKLGRLVRIPAAEVQRLVESGLRPVRKLR